MAVTASKDARTAAISKLRITRVLFFFFISGSSFVSDRGGFFDLISLSIRRLLSAPPIA